MRSTRPVRLQNYYFLPVLMGKCSITQVTQTTRKKTQKRKAKECLTYLFQREDFLWHFCFFQVANFEF
jgi:hypothetical protein